MTRRGETTEGQTMTTTEDVLAAAEVLRDALNDAALELAEVPAAVEDRNRAALRETLVDDDDDATALDKWFCHYQGGSEQASAVESLAVGGGEGSTSDVEYVLVRSEMYSRNKAARGSDDDDGSYHAVWVIGPDGDGQDYFIHRVEWRKQFETPLDEAGWTVADVRSWLGYEAPLPPADEPLEAGTWHQLQGDVIVKRVSITLKELIDEEATNEAEREQRQTRRAAKEAALEGAIEASPLTDHDNVTARLKSFHGPPMLEIQVHQSKTSGLKDIQSALGIEEETIREMMDDEWQRLTANRREELLCRKIKQAVTDRVGDIEVPSQETLYEAAIDEAQTQPAENRQQQHLIVGNHLVTIADGVEPYPGPTVQEGAASILVPEPTTIHAVHDEHGQRRREINPGIITLDVMERHERA